MLNRFPKRAANAIGIYVSIKSGKENTEKIFLAVPAWMFFHSVMSVIVPRTKSIAHPLKTVSPIDQIAIMMSFPVTAPMMP